MRAFNRFFTSTVGVSNSIHTFTYSRSKHVFFKIFLHISFLAFFHSWPIIVFFNVSFSMCFHSWSIHICFAVILFMLTYIWSIYIFFTLFFSFFFFFINI